MTAAAAAPPHVLREYALLADGERGAVVGPRGDVVWMCAPAWDDPAVFASLIGGIGHFAVTPTETYVWGGYYEPNSLIWRSRWTTHAGPVECREALAFPGEPHRLVLLRRVSGTGCAARVRVVLHPRADYGKKAMRAVHLDRDTGLWTARLGELHLRIAGLPGAELRDGALVGELDVPHGQEHDLVLELSDRPLPGTPVDAAAAWRATRTAWDEHVPAFADCLAPSDVQHSYAVLRGLTGSSGGMVAAATTSLPERAWSGRNYDYRYVWVRDQCFAGQAAAAAGAAPLLDDAVRFVTARLLDHGDRMAPAYRTNGEPVPSQRHLKLPGYPGGSDIVGNWVNEQFQLDAFGEALLLLGAAARHDRLDDDGRKAAHVAARAIEARWGEPDAGIWEIDPQYWTHSRLVCVAGLRSFARAEVAADAARELGLADAILAETGRTAVHPTGRWQRSTTDPGVDAALILPPVRGALPGDDPRTVATLDAVLADLTEDGYVYRFRHDERPLSDSEGAFLLCGLMLVLAQLQQGRTVDAFRWYERMKAACGPPVLYTEEFDVHQHQLRGNLPQAFVHALLIECSAVLGKVGD